VNQTDAQDKNVALRPRRSARRRGGQLLAAVSWKARHSRFALAWPRSARSENSSFAKASSIAVGSARIPGVPSRVAFAKAGAGSRDAPL
jgi:hypothetical protein